MWIVSQDNGNVPDATVGEELTERNRPTSTKTVTLGSASAYVAGVGEQQEIMRTKDHVDLNGDESDDDVTYNSVPPTSGDHWSTPVRCGFYNQPVPDELIVHNMEHSNVIVSYNLPDPSDLDALVAIYADLPGLWRDHFTVVRPYPDIPEGSVALTTWGVIDAMDGVDGERIVNFYRHYVGRMGPEGAISCRGTQDAMSGR